MWLSFKTTPLGTEVSILSVLYGNALPYNVSKKPSVMMNFKRHWHRYSSRSENKYFPILLFPVAKIGPNDAATRTIRVRKRYLFIQHTTPHFFKYLVFYVVSGQGPSFELFLNLWPDSLSCFRVLGGKTSPWKSSLLWSLMEDLCVSPVCLGERHLLGSFNPVLVNLCGNEYWGNTDPTSIKSTCPGRLLTHMTLALVFSHLPLLLALLQWWLTDGNEKKKTRTCGAVCTDD